MNSGLNQAYAEIEQKSVFLLKFLNTDHTFTIRTRISDSRLGSGLITLQKLLLDLKSIRDCLLIHLAGPIQIRKIVVDPQHWS